MERLDDRYSVGEQIGRGGVGEVYRGLQTTLQRPVAIKILRQELSFRPTSVARFKREAFTTSRLNHPNIVTVYDIGQTDDHQPFVVMELLDGMTLGQRLRNQGKLKTEEVLTIAQQVIRGMAASQGVGLVHRDLKPDNIFLQDDGLVKVLDFGLATLLEPDPELSLESDHTPLPVYTGASTDTVETLSHLVPPSEGPDTTVTTDEHAPVTSIELDLAREGRLTRPGALVGTPRYMAPEQVLGWAVDPRTDLYAFGVILFEALAGRTPFTGKRVEVIMRHHLQTVPEPLSQACPAAPRALCQIVDRLLAKDPSDRFEDWTALGKAIRPLLRISGGESKPGTLSSKDQARPKEPFRFLHPFNESSAQIFFGRDRDTQRFQDAWQHSDAPPLVILCGASGVGKSSFLGARICPYLDDTGHQIIRVAGSPAPLDQVRAIAFGRLANEGVLEEGGSLNEVLDRLVSRLGGRMAIVLDQLEELFTTGTAKQQARFQGRISSLIMGSEGRIRILLSLREDYLGQLLRVLHPMPVEQISRTLALRPLDAKDIAQALVGPGRSGLDVDYAPFEWERGLVEEVVADLLDDPAGEVAPRIQAVGARLWEMERDTPLPHRISRIHYRHRLSGAKGILSRILDEAIEAQPTEDRGAAKELLRALTHLPGSPTSRPAPESVLLAYTDSREKRQQILQRLERPWRVVHGFTDPRWPEERTYRIAHEALVQRIQQYGDEASELNRARQVFSHGLSLWLQGGRQDGDLLPDGHFDLVQRNIQSLVIHTPDEARFYEACTEVLNSGWLERHRTDQRRRLKQRLLVSFVPVLAIAFGMFLGQAPVQFTTWNTLYVRLLDGLSVQSADLRERGLQGANLQGLELIAPQLEGANLRYANLNQSLLPSASLVGANLDGAQLIGADLRGANLSDASVNGAIFNLADLSSARLSLDTESASFFGARFNLSTQWPDAPPHGALGPAGNIDDLDLRGINLTVSFDQDAVVNLQKLSALRARLDGANLSGVRLDSADLRESQFLKANLLGAYLEEADLDDADLSGANLAGANLQFASLQRSQLKNADLTGAILRGANLTDANVCGADLRSAKLEGSIWTNSTICPTTQWPADSKPSQ